MRNISKNILGHERKRERDGCGIAKTIRGG